MIIIKLDWNLLIIVWLLILPTSKYISNLLKNHSFKLHGIQKINCIKAFKKANWYT